MSKHTKFKIKLGVLVSGLVVCISAPATAATISWVATGSSDMENISNWNPSSVPGSSDTVVFNSALTGVNLTPTEQSSPFSVAALQFANAAAPFTISVENQTLTLTGSGITGTNTDATINITNSDNGSFLGNLLGFTSGSVATSGAAAINITNTGTLSGAASGATLNPINSQLNTNADFLMGTGGTLTVINSGTDSANGTGNNGIANTASSQIKGTGSFTAGDDVAISVSNSGTFSGNNSVQGDSVAIVNGSQFDVSGAFQAGDNLDFSLANNGTDSSTGAGLSNIAQINASQALFGDTVTVGNGATFLISNLATANANLTNFANFTGYLNDEQLFVNGAFQAGNGLNLTVTNTGHHNNTGVGGGQTAIINSNSGTTGNQALFNSTFNVGNDAMISVQNTGTATGTNTGGGPNVAGMNLSQLEFGDAFVAGTGLNLSVSNSGTDSIAGTGGDSVGAISTNQLLFDASINVGNGAAITVTNNGNFSGSNSATYNNVGSVGTSQVNATGNLQAGDGFTLHVENTAADSSAGIGQNFVGDIINSQQVRLADQVTVGDNATFLVTNDATASNSATNARQVGSMMGAGGQFYVGSAFLAGDGLNMTVTNTGQDTGSGAGSFVGFINNNTASPQFGNQQYFGSTFTVGDNATITVENIGTASGNRAGAITLAAVLSNDQLAFAGAFHAGNALNISVSNEGTASTAGAGGDSVGTAGLSQLEFKDTAIMGNNATIVLSNAGINSSTSASNNVGVINVNQLLASGTFTAGENLQLSINNTATDTGTAGSIVGTVYGSQAEFQQAVSIGNGSLISASNSGTVGGSQLLFDQGFTVSSGKAVIEATNTGTVGDNGITILGSGTGGNASISLHNASLSVDTTGAFTIGGLAGDATSTAESHQDLIINTDGNTVDTFEGVIQDFTATASTLTKEGAGAQILAGASTYTGLTTVNGGLLILTGSLAGDVTVNSAGEFFTGNTSGNSIVAGNLVNHGIVSIGIARTLTVGSFATAPTDGTVAFAAGNAAGSLATGHIDTTTTAVDLSHQVISVNYAGGLLNAGMSSLIATGTGAAVVPLAAVTDSSVLYDFSVAQGTGGNTNNLYLVAAMASLADQASNANNLQVSQVLLTDLSGTSDPTITQIQNDLANASTHAGYNSILASTLPTVNNSAAASAESFTSQVFELANSQIVSASAGKTGLSSGSAPSQGMRFWTQGFGQRANQSGENSVAGYTANTLGIAVGIDTRDLDEDNVKGLSFAYGKSHIFGDDVNNTRTDVDTYQLTLYGHHTLQNNNFMTGMAALGWDRNANTRYNVGGSGLNADADYNSWQGAVRGEFGHRFQSNAPGNLTVTPSLSAEYLHYDAESYTESGAGGANLHVAGIDENLLNLGIGGRAQWALKTASGLRVNPELHARYQHDVLNSDSADTTASFAAGGPTFSTQGLNPSNSRFDMGLGVKVYGEQNWDIAVAYDLKLRSDYTANSGSLRAAYHF